jgi:hypothetical protein
MAATLAKTAKTGIVCTYCTEKQSIAWFRTEEGQLKFIGYGKSAPSSSMGFDHDSDAPWHISGVTLTNKNREIAGA